MIDLSKEDLSIILDILNTHIPEYKVCAFGSRVNGKSSKYSDLDLVVMSNKKLDCQVFEDLKYAFSESDLPIIVDIVDWGVISDNFQKAIANQCVVLKNDNK